MKEGAEAEESVSGREEEGSKGVGDDGQGDRSSHSDGSEGSDAEGSSEKVGTPSHSSADALLEDASEPSSDHEDYDALDLDAFRRFCAENPLPPRKQ